MSSRYSTKGSNTLRLSVKRKRRGGKIPKLIRARKEAERKNQELLAQLHKEDGCGAEADINYNEYHQIEIINGSIKTEIVSEEEEEDIPPAMLLMDADESEVERNKVYFWTRNSTLQFLDLCAIYRPKVHTHEIKNFKHMFEVIASELSMKLNKEISPTHCENRWRILERDYKKFIDNFNQNGKGQRYFEFAEIMSQILGDKTNLKQQYLQERVTEDGADVLQRATDNRNPLATKMRATKHAKYNTLEKLISERRKFYRKNLELEEKKLEEQIKYNALMEKKLKLEEMKLQEEKKIGEILQQSNLLLREIIDKYK